MIYLGQIIANMCPKCGIKKDMYDHRYIESIDLCMVAPPPPLSVKLPVIMLKERKMVVKMQDWF